MQSLPFSYECKERQVIAKHGYYTSSGRPVRCSVWSSWSYSVYATRHWNCGGTNLWMADAMRMTRAPHKSWEHPKALDCQQVTSFLLCVPFSFSRSFLGASDVVEAQGRTLCIHWRRHCWRNVWCAYNSTGVAVLEYASHNVSILCLGGTRCW